MPNAVSLWIDFAEDCLDEFRGRKWYRRMTYAYTSAALADGLLSRLAPDVFAKIHSLPILSLLSLSTWIILALILALIAAIDCGRRILAKRTRKPNRPKLDGSAFDLYLEPYSEPSKEAIIESRRLNRPVVFTGEDIRGCHVYLGVDFINEGDAETVIRKFRLEVETNNGYFSSDNAEDDEIVQIVEGQSRSESKPFYNLNTHVTKMKTVRLGKLNHGHLHFIVRNLMLPQKVEEAFVLVNIRVIVADQWGDSHTLPLIRNRNTEPKPSERIRYVPPTQYW